MDSVRGQVSLVETSHARLRSASFLDGREKFWTGERRVPLVLGTNALGTYALGTDGPHSAPRFIFHVGFCGSTLLARLLDRPGTVLALKEPQCLADLAGQRRAIMAGEAIAPIGLLIDHALGRLHEAGAGLEPVVVKPTNWVNSLLQDLCAPERDVRAVFVSMDRRAFLGAVFRGGRARLEFCTRLAAEIAAVTARGNALLGRAIASTDDPLARAARITALLHALQETQFDSAIAANGWPDEVRVDFADLVAHPAAVLPRVRSVLGLKPADDDPVRSVRLMQRHTKNPATAFTPSNRLQEDDAVERHHGARFDAALSWLESIRGDLG